MELTKRSTTLLVLCILFVNILSAQKIKWGELLVSEDKKYTPTIIDDDEDNFYLFERGKYNIILESISKNTLKKNYSVDLGKFTIGNRFEGIYGMRNIVVILTSRYGSEGSGRDLCAEIRNKSDGQLKGEIKKILTYRSGMGVVPEVNVSICDGMTKLMLHFRVFEIKDLELVDKFLLLDEEMNIITEREDRRDDDNELYKVTVDNDGSVYYIKTMPSGIPSIISYDANHGYEKWESVIDLSDMDRDLRAFNLKFALNSDNDIILGGYYSTEKKSIMGTFSMKISSVSKEILYKKVNKFDDLMLQNLLAGNRDSKSKKALPVGNRWSEIKPVENGGYLWVCENRTVITNKPEAYIYELIVAYHSVNGDLKWVKKIPKAQHAKIRGNWFKYFYETMSYFAMVNHNQLIIWQNEQTEFARKQYNPSLEFPLTTIGQMNKMKECSTVFYCIDIETGKISKEMVTPQLKDSFLKPSHCYQRRFDSDALFFSQKVASYRYGIIRYNPEI